MKRTIAALFLAAFATVSFAQEDVTVANADSCPAGTFASVPSYAWQDGGFVRDGWLCESLDQRD